MSHQLGMGDGLTKDTVVVKGVLNVVMYGQILGIQTTALTAVQRWTVKNERVFS